MFKRTQAVAAFTLGFSVIGGASVANAADLGGDCCADLEERVAELEATAARKGNRKVSLKIYGQVHEAVSFWDDGSEKNVYVGSSNNSRSRFGFKGKASISADWSAGFLMEIGVRANDLSDIDQDTPADDQSFDIRHEALYINSKTFGTLWLGWSNTATQGITEIDLGGASIAEPDVDGWFGAFELNFGGNRSGNLEYEDLGRWTLNPGEGDRRNVVRYVSPTFAGFSLSASAGQDDFWDVALRYANEFGDFRIAGGIGYQQITDSSASNCETATAGDSDVDCSSLGLSASLMHTPTGLYLSGAYGLVTDDKAEQSLGAGVEDEDSFFYINAGISKKFSPIGKTIIYGEYYDFEGGARSRDLTDIPEFAGSTFLAESEMQIYGFGVVQKIDSAAMEIYAGYRHLQAEASDNIGTSAEAEDLDVVQVGARIKF